MNFRAFIAVLLLSFLPGAMRAAPDPIPATKQAELLKLFHYSGCLKDFHESVVGGLNETKKLVERPETFWEAVERDIDLNPYSKWWISVVNERLTEKELLELNAIFASPEKKEIFDELGRIALAKPGQDHDEDVKALREKKGADSVNEILMLVGSEAFRDYISARKTIDEGEREMAIKLINEAAQRVTNRFNHAH